MSAKSNPPSISKTSFDCPYCSAFTTQYWFNTYSASVNEETRLPSLFDPTKAKGALSSLGEIPEHQMQQYIELFRKLISGSLVLERTKTDGVSHTAHNLSLSKCYNCHNVAVWVHNNLVYPHLRTGPEPNPGMPPDIIVDFDEARSILNLSPRGAAAVLRLCIQKLCATLGGKGKNLENDIATLVAQGLSPLVQQSLDVVRVIGNEAVHPGVIDLRDDRETATSLLALVNLIADQMISNPKHVQEIYNKLPANKRAAIEFRNERALNKP